MFRQAQRLRDQGRFEDAAELVTDALIYEPGSVVGHLLAGSLHMTLRETGQARTAFERVLALEPTQPRALLGLARISLEDGDAGTCRDLLSRALARYPDFPEARALLELTRDLTRNGSTSSAPAASAVKLARIATAVLARAGFGPLRHAVIEGAAETTYLRMDDAALLTLAFDRDVTPATAVSHLERAWGRCRSELA